MIIKVTPNKNILSFLYDDSIESTVSEFHGHKSDESFNAIFAGLPTAGISSNPIEIDHVLYINMASYGEIKIFDNFDNHYALEHSATQDKNCTKNIAFCSGMQATILAFNKESEGEYQRIRRIIDEYFESSLITK
jgi:hypothetical protein